MSDDQLVSIEENGNYWLSKSNTAYHIINPNTTNLTTIEANGYYSLTRGGDAFYVLDASGNSIKLNLNGRTFFNDFTGVVSQTGSTFTYNPTNVEENPFDGGFLVLASRNDVTPNWSNTSFFNYNNFGFEFDTLGKYTGSDIITVNNHAFPRPGIEYERLFGLDLDDDGNIATGANPTNLLNISGNQHHIDEGHGGDSIIIKRDNVTIDPNSNGGWSVTQVEDSETGYEVFWSHSSGKFKVWKVDGSGEFQSQVTAHLWQHEKTFESDLNGDGIDSGDNYIFDSIGKNYFDGGAGDDIINGSTGHDTLIGGEGNDRISGDGSSGYAGNDILFGNAGNDWLRGRDGDDQIDGGTGSDTIITDTGSDKIILRAGDGGNTLSDADIITDFTDGSDNFGLDGGLLFSQLVIAQGSGDYASDTIISKGSEYLAILQGIDVSLLSDADFDTVDIA